MQPVTTSLRSLIEMPQTDSVRHLCRPPESHETRLSGHKVLHDKHTTFFKYKTMCEKIVIK